MYTGMDGRRCKEFDVASQTVVRLDLIQRQAEELAIDVEMSAGSLAALIERLGWCGFAPQEKGVYVFEETYEASDKPHTIRAFILAPEDNFAGAAGSISIRYQLGLPSQPATDVPSVSRLLDCLSDLAVKLMVRCSTSFALNGDEYKSVYPLPQQAGPDAAGLYDEVRGVRLTKNDQGKPVYQVVIDRPSDDRIFSSVAFTVDEELSTNLPRMLLDLSSEVSSYFVRPIGR